MTQNLLDIASFSEILGTASTNVPAYSNTTDGFFSIERNFVHGIFTGIRWQCVEYARRWLLLRKSCIFKSVRHAADIWSQLSSVERVTDGQHFPLKLHPNGSSTPPIIDSFLIYSRSEEQPVGHIAIISSVGSDHICVAEQNNKFHFWENDYARRIPLIQKDGLYYIEDEDAIYGWMEIDDHNQLQPFNESLIPIILPEYQQTQPIGKMDRSSILYQYDDSKKPWLNKDDPVEKYFMELYGDELHGVMHCPQKLHYYKINQDLRFSIGNASNELHRMYIDATAYVIQTDELLTRFAIPEIFWNRIRQSWINDRNLTMIGRFDFAFDDKQLKVLEYNAESTETLFQAAIIQRKWAEAASLPSTFTSAFRLHHNLVSNWKRMHVKSLVHIFIDDNNSNDERLSALYMQNIFKEAGIESKICRLTDQFYWKDSIIIDNEGLIVEVVWKVSMWQSVFQEYLEGINETALNNENSSQHSAERKLINSKQPRLSDILLHDQIKVIEPLWKVITSHRALLPVLWGMYPNHPLLLRSEWTTADNLTLLNGNSSSLMMDEAHIRSGIYQEMFQSKNYDGHYPIISSWIVHGHFAGFNIREDQKLTADVHSASTICCVDWQDEK